MTGTDVSRWTAVELSYLAGLLDGEGYFNQRDSGSLVVRMASPTIVKWAHDTFGGRLNGRARRLPHHKDLDEWTLEKQADLYLLLPAVLPYLRHKKLECEMLYALVAHAVENKPRRRNAGDDAELKAEWATWHEGRTTLQERVRQTRLDPVRVLVLDPGERCGWARVVVLGNELVVQDHGMAYLKDMALAMHRAVVLERKYDVVVYEKWILTAKGARVSVGSAMESSQFVGMIRQCCWIAGIKSVGQSTSALSSADRSLKCGHPSAADVARRIAITDAVGHDDGHDGSALRHAWSWFFKEYV